MKKKNAIKAIESLNQIIDIVIFTSLIILSILFVIFIAAGIVLPVLKRETIILLEEPFSIILPILHIIFIISAVIYLTYRRKKKSENPNFRQEEAAEAMDERGINIDGKASTATLGIVMMILLLITIVTGFLEYIMLSFITLGILCISLVVFFIFEAYYKKKM